MIIYLQGADSYRRKKRLKELVVACRAKYSLADVRKVDFEENPNDWEKIRDFLNQPSMFIEAKMVIVEENNFAGESEKDEKQWVKILKQYAEDKAVFFFIQDTKKPKKIYSFLPDVSMVETIPFEELLGVALSKFLDTEIKARGLQFAPNALQFFIRVIENEKNGKSWRAVSEFEKIYLASFPNPISLENIKKIISTNNREEVFSLARQILFSRNSTEKLSLLEKGFLQGDDSAYIFNSLGFQARGAQAVRLADYDIAVKSGRLEYEEALTEFCMK